MIGLLCVCLYICLHVHVEVRIPWLETVLIPSGGTQGSSLAASTFTHRTTSLSLFSVFSYFVQVCQSQAHLEFSYSPDSATQELGLSTHKLDYSPFKASLVTLVL